MALTAHRSRFVKIRAHGSQNIWLEDVVEEGDAHEGCVKIRTEYSPDEDRSVIASKKEALALANEIAGWYGFQAYEPKAGPGAGGNTPPVQPEPNEGPDVEPLTS